MRGHDHFTVHKNAVLEVRPVIITDDHPGTTSATKSGSGSGGDGGRVDGHNIYGSAGRADKRRRDEEGTDPGVV